MHFCDDFHGYVKVAVLKADNSWDGCGALLLSCDPLIVITAAHCVIKYGKIVFSELAVCTFLFCSRVPSEIKLTFGATKIGKFLDKFEVRMNVSEIVVHPEFRP